MDAVHLPLPEAAADVAFAACLKVSQDNADFVADFQRLFRSEAKSMKGVSERHAFILYVHEAVYMRMSPELILSVRASAKGT